jgi:hypothetical protein
MQLSRAAWFIILVLIGATIVIWLPYLWPPAGYRLRRSEGPWLANFDHKRQTLATARDILFTIGLWLGLLFMPLTRTSPFFWIIAIASMASIFASAFLADRFGNYNKSTSAVTLYSSAQLDPKTLREFLVSVGALIPGKQQPYTGRLSYPDGYVWITNVSDMYAKAQTKIAQLYTSERAEQVAFQAKMRAHLGSDAQTILFISIMQAKDLSTGERRAMEFIRQFAQQYPCIVSDAYENLLAKQDIQAALDKNELVLGFQRHMLENRGKR